MLDRSVEPGDIVQPAKRLMTIALDGATRLTALIDEKNLGVLSIGQKALAAANAFPGQRFEAVLEYLAPGIDAQRGTVEAKFAVAKPPAFLRSDMTVSIDVAVAQQANALVVPTGAVHDAAPELAMGARAARRPCRAPGREARRTQRDRGRDPRGPRAVERPRDLNVPPDTRVRAHEGRRP